VGLGRAHPLAAGEDGDAGPGRRGRGEDPVGQASAGVDGHDDVVRRDRLLLEAALDEGQAAGERRPGLHQGRLEAAEALGPALVDEDRRRAPRVEEEEDRAQEAVAGGQLDDPAAAEAAPDALGDGPGLEELLAGEALGRAHDPTEPVAEAAAGEGGHGLPGEAGPRRGLQREVGVGHHEGVDRNAPDAEPRDAVPGDVPVLPELGSGDDLAERIRTLPRAAAPDDATASLPQPRRGRTRPRAASPGTAAGATPGAETAPIDAEDGARADTSPAAPAPDARDGRRRIGPYVLERELARGGMGVVYLARHEMLDRPVALKFVLGGGAASEGALKRFLFEARSAARLRHPNVVAIHDVGEVGGHPYLAMDLVEGDSLADRIERDGPLAPKAAARIGEKLARALAYAHGRSLLHRDVKPANVLLDAAGEPHLTDFGLAKDVDEPGTLTQTGQVVGSPPYMPPEQATGDSERVDRRADVYALGATLYEALTGRPPFSGPTVLHVIRSVVERDPRPPSTLRPDVDRDLETIVLKCLEKDPDRRYPTASALAADLRRYADDLPVFARRPGRRERAARWLRRNSTLAQAVGGLLALGAVVGIGALGAFVWRLEQERVRARQGREVAEEALADLVGQVQGRLDGIPGGEARELRLELLETARAGYARLQAVEADAPPSPDAVRANLLLGELAAEMGDQEGAEAAFATALQIGRALVARSDDRVARTTLARALARLARARLRLGEATSARALADEAVAIWRAEVHVKTSRLLMSRTLAAGDRRGLEERVLARGVAGEARHALGDAAGARELLRTAVQEARMASFLSEDALERPLVSQALVRLGRVQADQGDLEPALGSFEEALALDRRRVADGDRSALARWTLAGSLESVGAVYARQGDVDDALEKLEEALNIRERLCDEDPSNGRLAEELRAAEERVYDLREEG